MSSFQARVAWHRDFKAAVDAAWNIHDPAARIAITQLLRLVARTAALLDADYGYGQPARETVPFEQLQTQAQLQQNMREQQRSW